MIFGGDMDLSEQFSLTETPSASNLVALQILEFLNDKAGRRYRGTTVNLSFIEARLNEGYSADQLRQVVAMKVREWSHDEKMAKYLRPETLFNRTKFNSYVGCLDSDE